jgi:hypothetical protein
LIGSQRQISEAHVEELFMPPRAEGTSVPNLSRFFFGSALSGTHAFISNRSPQVVQTQRLITKLSLTNSDQSGEISVSPHLTHLVIMATSFG